MRNRLHRVSAKVATGFASAQGVLGVAAVAGGTFLLAGIGWALIVIGAFLLVGALLASPRGGAR